MNSSMTAKLRAETWKKFENQEAKILVASDIASRGLDTLNVGLVINFDFAYTGVDYIHRAGRTARAGSRGKVISLISKKDQAMARAVEHSLKVGETVEKWNQKNSWQWHIGQKIKRKLENKKTPRSVPQIMQIRKQRAKDVKERAKRRKFEKYLLK